MEETKRQLYEAPESNVLELDIEGVVCMSGDSTNPDVVNTDV